MAMFEPLVATMMSHMPSIEALPAKQRPAVIETIGHFAGELGQPLEGAHVCAPATRV